MCFSFSRVQLLRKFAWILPLIGGNTPNIAHDVYEVTYALFDVLIPKTMGSVGVLKVAHPGREDSPPRT